MIVWLTGNTGAGKTTLAKQLKLSHMIEAVILDGDEMRTVWTDLGLSQEHRRENNLRVSRMAKIISSQGNDVIVSVIAPNANVRAEIDKAMKVFWVYISREKDKTSDPNRPYMIPENPNLTVYPERESVKKEAYKVMEALIDLEDSSNS